MQKKCSLAELLEGLSGKAVDHIAYYHYTQWQAFKKMMTPIVDGPAKGHRLLLLTNTSKTNDGLEEKWAKRYYMACFSLSRYEDVAMWLNYGKKSPDAVRVKFTRDSIENWKERQPSLFTAEMIGGEYKFNTDISEHLASVKFYGVAYVIPSQHWVEENDGITQTHDREKFIVQNGNVELGRDFYEVSHDGDKSWVDKIYNREDLSELDIPPVFKKRGWAYEREIRLVVELKKNSPLFPERIALTFDEPLCQLEEHMKLTQKEREETFIKSEWTPKIKIWDKRFPMVQSGPWYDDIKASADAVCGFTLKDAHRSEYEKEIKMFDSVIPSCSEYSGFQV